MWRDSAIAPRHALAAAAAGDDEEAAALIRPSVTCLFLVTEGQHAHRVVRWLVAVKGDVSGVPEGNHQLAQLGYFR